MPSVSTASLPHRGANSASNYVSDDDEIEPLEAMAKRLDALRS